MINKDNNILYNLEDNFLDSWRRFLRYDDAKDEEKFGITIKI